MQKKIKNILILLIVVLVIAVAVLIILQSRIKNEQKNNELSGEKEEYANLQNDSSNLINGEKLEEVQAEGIYLTLDRLISKYNEYIEQNNSEAVYSILYDEYMQQNNITKNNVLQIVKQYENYKIMQMFGLSAVNYGIYYIKINSNNIICFIMINWDTQNDTFSICEISEEQYNKGIQQGIEVDKQRIQTIQKNDYNTINIWKTSSDSIAKKYFYDFIELVLNNTEEAYNILDEDYRKLNFETYNDFRQFVNYNNNKLKSLDHNNFKDYNEFENYEDYERYYQEASQNGIEDYAETTSNNGIRTYIYKDTYGGYYIFKVTAAMNYTVRMDNYTIVTDDFKQTYNSRTEPQRVVLNIERFFKAINDKNYGYAYNVLADSFKQNSYPTKNDFINYVRQNFFEQNKVEYIKYEKQTGLYIYQIKLKDATNNSQQEKSLNIIMKLGNDTNFEMSFGEN